MISDRVGVHSPESVIYPEALFTALARLFDRVDWREIVIVESEFRKSVLGVRSDATSDFGVDAVCVFGAERGCHAAGEGEYHCGLLPRA